MLLWATRETTADSKKEAVFSTSNQETSRNAIHSRKKETIYDNRRWRVQNQPNNNNNNNKKEKPGRERWNVTGSRGKQQAGLIELPDVSPR